MSFISLVWVHSPDTEATDLFRWLPSSFLLCNLYSGFKLQHKAEHYVICPCHVTSISIVYSSKGPCWSQNSLVAPTYQVQRGSREVRGVYINGCNTESASGTRNYVIRCRKPPVLSKIEWPCLYSSLMSNQWVHLLWSKCFPAVFRDVIVVFIS